MPNALTPNTNDPWAWNQWAQTQDPNLYGWQKTGLGLSSLTDPVVAPALRAAGLWKPEWDAYIANTTYGENGASNPGDAPDLSSLSGYQFGDARSNGYNHIQGIFDPSGNQVGQGQVGSMAGSGMKRKDWIEGIGTALAPLAIGSGLGALGIGSGIGTAAAEGTPWLMAGDAGYVAPGGFSGAGLGTIATPTSELAPMAYNPSEFGGVLNASGATGAGTGSAALEGGGIGTLGNIAPGAMGSGPLGATAMPAIGSTVGSTALPSAMGEVAGSSFLGGLSAGNWAQLGAGALGYLGNQQAIKAGTDATNQANQLQRDIFNQQTAQNQPLIDTRNSALGKINALLADPSSVTKEPGYQFGLDQGQRQLNNQQAAAGTYYSGGQQKAAARYNQDYASTKLNDTYNRLANVAGLGQTGSNNQNNALTNYGNTVGNNTTNLGNFRGSGYINGANQIGNALGNVANDWQTQNYLQNLRKGP